MVLVEYAKNRYFRYFWTGKRAGRFANWLDFGPKSELAPLINYSILSDGSGLEPLEVEMPPLPGIPEGLPNGTKKLALERSISPNGAWLAYVSRTDEFSKSRQLYIVRLAGNEAHLIYETPDQGDTQWYIAGL